MSTPTTDSIRSQIRQAAIYGLKNRIIEGGTAIRYSDAGNTTVSSVGYYNSFGDMVFDPPKSWEQIPQFPACNVSMEEEVCANGANVQLDQNQALLHNGFRLRMDCFLNDDNDPALAQDKILHDVQKYFGINYYIPDSTGAATAFNCYYESSDPFGIDKVKPNCGITIYYKVWYRQQLINPAVSG